MRRASCRGHFVGTLSLRLLPRQSGRHRCATLLALQLPFSTISGLLRRHGSEITRGGCRGRGCAGVVGLFAARGEAADAAAVQPRAGGGLGGAVSWWAPAGPRGADRVGGGAGGGGVPPPGP